MGAKLDLKGIRVGRLKVIREIGYKEHEGVMWECMCDCGNTHRSSAFRLNNGKVNSCGCYQKEVAARVQYKHGHAPHGKMSSTYRTWARMVQRCTNEDGPDYEDYGGRGIGICSRWMQFENFLLDMGEKPDSGVSLDRLDNNKGYGPGNCRWATGVQQARNRRNCRMLRFRGEVKNLSEWCEVLGLAYDRTKRRLARGWSVEKAFCEKKRVNAYV